MTDRGLSRIVRRLHHLGDGNATELPDAELLRRFAMARDEAAFATIVRRHGPMVHRICRQLLRESHDAEDAFQATFLVLVRKALSIRRHELLANWLYGVARRVALRARSTMVRFRTHTDPRIEPAADDMTSEPGVREMWSIVHEEVARLPTKYRVPVVLCYLEGKAHDEAAALLRWPKGTVAGRLARARDLLHTRLVRRGVVIPAGGLAVLIWADAAPAAFPSAILHTTVVAAAAYAATPESGALISQTVISLTEGIMKAMFINKVKNVILFGGLALLFAAASAGLIAATASHRAETSRGSMAQAGPRNGSDASSGERRGEKSDAESKPMGSSSRPETSSGSGSKEPESPKKEADTIVTTLQAVNGATVAGFSPDGKSLLVTSDAGPELYEIATGNRTFRLKANPASVFLPGEGVLAPDGNTIVAVSGSTTGRINGAMVATLDGSEVERFISWPCQMIDPDTGKFEGVGTSLARFSADGHSAAIWTTDGKITIWDLATGKSGTAIEVGTHQDRGMAIAPDGKQVAAFKLGREPRLKVWDAATGKEILSLESVEPRFDVGGDLQFSPDGKTLMSVAMKTLTLWDIKTGKITQTIKLKNVLLAPTEFAISPNGKMMAIAQNNENLRIVDIATGKDLAECHWVSRPAGVTWSRDGKYIACGREGRLRIWDVEALLKAQP
jgi:RNA polymerase sigma factor (sigma-70 family)